MIISNIRYPFGRKLAIVETPSFNCMIRTAKEGLFAQQSIMFSVFGSGIISRRHVARLLFNNHLGSADRLQLHDIITGMVDEAGMSGKSLHDTLRELFEDLEGRDIGHGEIFQE